MTSSLNRRQSALLMAGFLGAAPNLVFGDEKPLGPDGGEMETAGATLCPLYVVMRYGSYCSYYAMVSPGCTSAAMMNSTNCSLPPANCAAGTGCIQTLAHQLRSTASDDPGQNGYGHGLSGSAGSKKLKLGKGSSAKWPGQANELTVEDFDNFDVNFRDANNQPVRAQVIVVKATVTNSGVAPALIGRGHEITRNSSGTAPENGWIGPVKEIPGRPHAYSVLYTPFGGAPAVEIEIITHHSTPGHGA